MKNLIYFLFIFILTFSNVRAETTTGENIIKNDEIPTTIDSRLKTLIYNENEIYELKFFYGFQSFIELSDDEEVELISLGESFPWKITPVGKRLFIRPIQIGANTNMMIVTTKRVYQFQIKSSSYEEGTDDELVYSIKFFYPDTTKRQAKTTLMDGKNTSKNLTLFNLDKDGKLNFDYVMTGNVQNLAPIKVFDNGINTYFEFQNKNTVIPYLYAVDINGNETKLDYTIDGNYVVINSVHLQISLRDGVDLLCIFNNKVIVK